MRNRPIRLLIVEDSVDDAELEVLALRKGGFDVAYDRVDTAAAMKTALDREHWDFIIADFDMHGFTGMRALEILKEHELDIPFVLVSGTVGEDVAVDAMRAGAQDYLMK